MVLITYSTGEHEVTYSFANSALYEVWVRGVSAIKTRIVTINNDRNAGPARVPSYEGWLELVRDFVQVWGDQLLPPDIKCAVNMVENGIQVPTTVWEDLPENYCV